VLLCRCPSTISPPMRPLSTVILAALLVGCAESAEVSEELLHPLVGTWELVEWRALDSLGVWQEDFGSDPRGYFVYGPSGVLSIHLMHQAGAEVDGCAVDASGLVDGEEFLVMPSCYAGYFGSYRIEDDSTVVHLPIGGTILSYIGTEQPRRFEVMGDSLWIQRSESVHRLLRRVR
jgi:hypothetical protein